MRFEQLTHLAATLLVNTHAVFGDHLTTSETPYTRSYFYVGGHYVDIGSGDYGFQGQMYVERLIPTQGIAHDTPIVLIHGQGQTGTNFLNKPDGGRGWASQFTEQGYEVYIIDQTARGRSPWPNNTYSSSIAPPFSVNTVQSYFTAAQDYLIWPQAVNHTQWPGSGRMGDPIFDTFYASQVHFIANETFQQETVQQAGAALLDKIGKPVIIAGHSQGGPMPMLIADARPKLVKALILLEPKGPPFREVVFGNNNAPARAWGVCDVPITYSPPVKNPEVDLVKELHPSPGPNLLDCVLQAENPKPKQLVNLADKPILFVTGESSYHAQYDYCTVQYLRQAGCSKVDHVELGKVGIHGNGHMFFMEKNSGDIQELLRKWIAALK